MDIPTDRMYAETHEWFVLEDDIVTLGITEFAATELTDITFVELPEVGASVSAGDAIGEVESVKATSELFCAVDGTVVESNAALVDHPELVNDDPFEEGWMVKVRVDSKTARAALDALMNAKAYKTFLRNTR